MRKIILFFLFLVLILQSLVSQANAYTPKGKFETSITATVGGVYLSLTGYASPLSSVILTSQGILLDSTVADDTGFFSFIQIPIKPGFSQFCLNAVDFKRIGESETCINTVPAKEKESIELKDIFLPPTIGLSKKIAKAGEEVNIYGYTRPGATVTININSTQSVTVQADETGFYSYTLKNVKAGKYTLFANAIYEKRPSLQPQKPATLEVLSKIEEIKKGGEEIAKKFSDKLKDAFSNNLLWFGLFCLFLFLLILFLLFKLKPEWKDKIAQKIKRKHKMHHDWFLEIPIDKSITQHIQAKPTMPAPSNPATPKPNQTINKE
ncbi:MAG: carboxypeptidase regulatory-like domain-containing protein [Armatimonadetes bacterium]|nr:MAG: carboxypeptidase regulatory-like domain-containing protein [Armatimonadota bacterium]